MSYLLYKLSRDANFRNTPDSLSVRGEITDFSPLNFSWFLCGIRAGGSEYFKVVCQAIWWAIFGTQPRKQHRVWAYVDLKQSILHYSVQIPSKLHLPWLPPHDLGIEIGACLTIPTARGKRLYPCVLNHIAQISNRQASIYMIVEDENRASQAGMARAGFEAISSLSRKPRLFRPAIYVKC